MRRANLTSSRHAGGIGRIDRVSHLARVRDRPDQWTVRLGRSRSVGGSVTILGPGSRTKRFKTMTEMRRRHYRNVSWPTRVAPLYASGKSGERGTVVGLGRYQSAVGSI